MDKMIYHLFKRDYTYYGPFKQPATVSLLRYNDSLFQKKDLTADVETVKEELKEGYMNWIRIVGLENTSFITDLLSELGFYSIDTKAIITPCHASKFNQKTGRLLIVLRSCRLGKKDIDTEHIAIIAKDNFVITFRELPDENVQYTETAIRENILEARNGKPMALVALLLNNIFSETIESALKIEYMLEQLDDILLDSTHSRLNIAKYIEKARHANLILQKNNIMLYKEFGDFIKNNVAIQTDPLLDLAYDELYDQIEYIMLTSDNCKELLASMRDLYTSNNELRTNSIMKRLTIVATLFIPVTFLAGIWGMNFRGMPELEWKYGYPMAILVIASTVFFTWRYMKRNKWF